MTASVLFHVQYLLGIGHLQRTLLIAAALVRAGVKVTVASGGVPVGLPRDPAIDWVQLPPVRAHDASFALFDSAGRPLDDTLRQARRAVLLAAFDAARPDAVVIEGFPFARRAFRFELEPLIAAIRAARPRPRLVCSVRDIVAAREDPVRQREIVERVRGDFDAVMVHGDPAIIPFGASFPAAPEIADRLVYTGYVAPPRPSGPRVSRSESAAVVVSAGGGGAGRTLLHAALAARRTGCLANVDWLLLTGNHIPDEDFAALAAAAPAGVSVERFRPGLAALLRGCRVSVSQAGYNTVLDVLAARARAVLVPFAAGREIEQLMRAERLAALGAAVVVRESELTPTRLATAIEEAAMRQPPEMTIDAAGAERSARLICGLIEHEGDFAAAHAPSMIAQ